MEKNTPKLYHGVIAFTAAFAYLMYIAPVVNGSRYVSSIGKGLFGVVLTQAIILSIAVLPVLITGADFNAIFPMRLLDRRSLFGVVFLYGGVYIFTLTAALIMVLLFPGMQRSIDNIQGLREMMPDMYAALLIVAFMPAVCEELLMRGFVLSSFRGTNGALAIVVTGVMFGILHLDPYRFVPTAILGMASAYVTLKTDSLVPAMLYHFANNAMSVTAMFKMGQSEAADAASDIMSLYLNSPLTFAGPVCIYISAALIMGYIGYVLINKRRARRILTPVMIITCFLLFVCGMYLAASNVDMSDFYSVMLFR